MKKITLLVVISLLTLACKNKSAEDQSLKEYKGEFIYTEKAAVIKGSDFIYGVTINEVALELAKKVAPVKRDEFDMVPVIVMGTVAEKPENQEGWDEILTIHEIVSVSETPSEADIKIEEKNN